MKKTFSILLSSLTLIAFPAIIRAATTGSATGITTGLKVDGTTSFGSFTDYMSHVFKFSLKAGSVLTIIMVIFAGYKYLTSQGNPTALNEAKDIIAGSLSGFILMLVIFFILRVLNIPAF